MSILESVIASLLSAIIFAILFHVYNINKSLMNKIVQYISKIFLSILGISIALFLLFAINAIIESVFFPNKYHHSNTYSFSNGISDTVNFNESINTRMQMTEISIDPVNDTHNWTFQINFFFNSSIKQGWPVPYCRIFKQLNVDTLYIQEFNPYYQINKVLPIIANYYKQKVVFNFYYINGGCEFEIIRNQQTIYKSSNFPGQEFLFLKAWGNGYDYSLSVKVEEYF